MKFLGGKCKNFFAGTPKKGRSNISAKIWPPGSEVLDPLVVEAGVLSPTLYTFS